MKPLRSGTIILALVVGGGSAATGVGLGRILTRVASAADEPGAVVRPKGRAEAKAVVIRPGGRPANARAAAAGLRIIYPNPRHLFPRPPGFSLNNNLRSTAVVPIPLWTYSITASAAMGGQTFSGTIVGQSPFDASKTTTTIATQIVPLVITITDTTTNPPTTVTYDPTAPDPCVPGHAGVDIITGSPLFTNNPWTMNGVDVGTTQYIDATQRAQFWSLVGGTPYHLVLQPSVLNGQALTFSGAGSSGPGQNYDATTVGGSCGSVGVVTNGDLDAAARALMSGPLAGMVNAGTLPIFLTKNVVSAQAGTDIRANCCILGYHNSFNVGGDLQIYSPFSLDTTGAFGTGFVGTLSHELGEAINDPTGVNATPSWGGLGQVVGTCQTNLEVGDPLSPGFGTPTNNFTVVGANGLTYSLQELAFANWFFDSPSLGAGGKSSSNGSFGGGAKPCPPGGTN